MIEYPFTAVPNMALDRLLYFLDSEESKCWIYAARRLLGQHARRGLISLNEFAEGRLDRTTGRQLDYGTGLAKPTIRAALARLHQFGALRQLGDATNAGTPYEIAVDDDAIDWPFLESRRAEAAERNQKRTAGARAKNPKHAGDAVYSPTTHPAPVDEAPGRPAVYSPTTHQPPAPPRAMPPIDGARGVVGLHTSGVQSDYTPGVLSDYPPGVVPLYPGMLSDYTPGVVALHPHDHVEEEHDQNKEDHAPGGASGLAYAQPPIGIAELRERSIGEIKPTLGGLDDERLAELLSAEQAAPRPRATLIRVILDMQRDRAQPAIDPAAVVTDLESALRLLEQLAAGRKVKGGARAVVAALYESHFPAQVVRLYPPNMGRLSMIAQQVSGGARWMCEQIAKTRLDLAGDPHDYLHGVASRSAARTTEGKARDGRGTRYEQREPTAGRSGGPAASGNQGDRAGPERGSDQPVGRGRGEAAPGGRGALERPVVYGSPEHRRQLMELAAQQAAQAAG